MIPLVDQPPGGRDAAARRPSVPRGGGALPAGNTSAPARDPLSHRLLMEEDPSGAEDPPEDPPEDPTSPGDPSSTDPSLGSGSREPLLPPCGDEAPDNTRDKSTQTYFTAIDVLNNNNNSPVLCCGDLDMVENNCSCEQQRDPEAPCTHHRARSEGKASPGSVRSNSHGDSRHDNRVVVTVHREDALP